MHRSDEACDVARLRCKSFAHDELALREREPAHRCGRIGGIGRNAGHLRRSEQIVERRATYRESREE